MVTAHHVSTRHQHAQWPSTFHQSLHTASRRCGLVDRCTSTLLCPATQVTKVKLEQKQKEGIAEARSGQRGPVSGDEG
jgi:hypothetical protein